MIELVEHGDIEGDELLLLSHWSSGEVSISFFIVVMIGWTDFAADLLDEVMSSVDDELTMVDVALDVTLFVEWSWAGMLEAAAVRFGSVLIWIYWRGCWIIVWWSARGTCGRDGRAIGCWITTMFVKNIINTLF